MLSHFRIAGGGNYLAIPSPPPYTPPQGLKYSFGGLGLADPELLRQYQMLVASPPPTVMTRIIHRSQYFRLRIELFRERGPYLVGIYLSTLPGPGKFLAILKLALSLIRDAEKKACSILGGAFLRLNFPNVLKLSVW